jgi:hypothetical protein
MSAPTLTTRPYNARGGFNERRRHPDGFSYWRNGELHREDGFAVFRDGRHEAWLFGHQIEVPEHDPRDPLTFAGQTKSGRINWTDSDGSIRAVTVVNASGVHETRWYDAIGDPEEHWRGNYHVRRVLVTGEIRYYRQASATTKPRLHRVDGPAVEDTTNPVRSKWCVDGAPVDGPLELLIKHTMRAEAAQDHGRPIVRLNLTDAQKGRLRITVITMPDSSLTSDIAMCFPDEYREAVAAAEWV